MIVCASLYHDNYSELAAKTLFDNRDNYSFLQDYVSTFRKYHNKFETGFELACFLGFEKIRVILESFQTWKDVSHVWFADCDAMVMNFGISIESITEKYPQDILIASDCNGSSCGSMIVKNTDRAKRYLQDILDNKDKYLHEQDYFWKNPADFILVTPQRVMNSWDCSLPHLGAADRASAQFQHGDFFIHWPAQSLEKRLELYEIYKGKVIG